MDDDPDRQARPGTAEPVSRKRPTRLILLLVLLLVASLSYLSAPGPGAAVPDSFHSRLSFHDVPEPAAPTGELADAFVLARPATLRIEVSSDLGRRSVVTGIGTGFFISADGLVLTAYHVVENPGILTGVGPEGDRYPLALVGFDAYRDLAVLQAEVRGEVPYLPLSSEAPRTGSKIVAIGNSRGEFLEPRSGEVLALGVDAPYASFASNTIELTAALSPGDSGGPVVNERGEAVGVVSYISFFPEGEAGSAAQFIPPLLRGLAPTRHYASFAVPVHAGSETLTMLERGLRRDVPVIGFSWRADYVPTPGSAPLGPRPGPVVFEVQPGSPADRAGLRSYRQTPITDAAGSVVGVDIEADVIVAVDGRSTRTFRDLQDLLYQKDIGQTVTLSVQRGDETALLELELGAKRRVFNE